jgi:hypothetical protein
MLIDGRVFEADKDVTVRLPPASCRPPLPPPPPTEVVPELAPVPRPGEGPDLMHSARYPRPSSSQRLNDAVHVLKPVPMN